MNLGLSKIFALDSRCRGKLVISQRKGKILATGISRGIFLTLGHIIPTGEVNRETYLENENEPQHPIRRVRI